MTPAEALAPALEQARNEAAALQREMHSDDVTLDTAKRLREANVRVEMLERLAGVTVSAATKCNNCSLRGVYEWGWQTWGCSHPSVKPREIPSKHDINGTRPDWCPLRAGPVLVMLGTP